VPVPVNPLDAATLEMGNLSALYYHADGRVPTIQEWNQVEKQTQTIFLLLTPALRRKFLMGGTPWIVAWMPVYFLGVAGLSLFFAVVTIESDWPIFLMLLDYLIWLATLGAVGALAFIGMNALSIQDDITFDLTNRRLMLLRVALGALFAVVLTLPFGYSDFLSFCSRIAKPFLQPPSPNTGAPDAGLLTKQAVLLLLPFVLGFSTSLVILILNQFVDAVQTFFGRRPSTVAPAQVPRRVTTDQDTSNERLNPAKRDGAAHTGTPPQSAVRSTAPTSASASKAKGGDNASAPATKPDSVSLHSTEGGAS
jgi:hypothetical protein